MTLPATIADAPGEVLAADLLYPGLLAELHAMPLEEFEAYFDELPEDEAAEIIDAYYRQYRPSLHEFVEASWSQVIQGEPFVDGEHIRGICQTLQGLTEGTITADVIINLPPGHMKSLLVNIFWPAWVWGPRGDTRSSWLFCSHSLALIVRDSQKRRDLIASDWYTGLWPVVLRDDENQKLKYENTAGGWMLSVTSGGQGTGQHPNYLCIDDPHNTDDTGQAALEKVKNWWSGKMGSRGVGKGVKRVLVMQRVDIADLTAIWLEENPDVVHICLPLEYSPGRMKATPLGWKDWRTEPGQRLWPEYMTPDKEIKLRRPMTAAVEAAQLDQRPPAQRGGADWPDEYFDDRIWCDYLPAESDVVQSVLSLDPSLGATDDGDYAAFVFSQLANKPHSDLRKFYVQSWIDRWDPWSIAVKTVDLWLELKPTSVVIEGNGFQSVLKTLIHKRCHELGYPILPVRLVMHYGGAKGAKRPRILASLTEVFKDTGIQLYRQSKGNVLLHGQLQLYPDAKYDDGPDALAMNIDEHRLLFLPDNRDEAVLER